MQSLVWQVCCDVSVGGSLALGLWKDNVDNLSGVAHGYGVSAGEVLGTTVIVWYGYGYGGRLVAEPKRFIGAEISVDMTGGPMPVSGGYFRSWTCTHVQKDNCPNILGK